MKYNSQVHVQMDKRLALVTMILSIGQCCINLIVLIAMLNQYSRKRF